MVAPPEEYCVWNETGRLSPSFQRSGASQERFGAANKGQAHHPKMYLAGFLAVRAVGKMNLTPFSK
jgi:hypothetical protein